MSSLSHTFHLRNDPCVYFHPAIRRRLNQFLNNLHIVQTYVSTDTRRKDVAYAEGETGKKWPKLDVVANSFPLVSEMADVELNQVSGLLFVGRGVATRRSTVTLTLPA